MALTVTVASVIGLALIPGRPSPPAHVLIGGYAAPQEDRAYIGPDGAFGPWPGSFGLSVDGGKATSYGYATARSGQPAFETKARGYVAQAVIEPDGARTLDITAARPINVRLGSAGPAGGGVDRLERDAAGLVVNRRWRVEPPSSAAIAIGRSRSGKPAATIRLPRGHSRIRLVQLGGARPALPLPQSRLGLAGVPAQTHLAVIAQSAALLHSIVGDETRPGDPISYPLAWQRDGAYAIVALARAGYPAEARRLAVKFARDDFFGGFGAEADAPGLAIWALSEAAAAAPDSDGFSARIWPDVQRKAALIETMLTAEKPVRARFVGPVIPALQDNDEATYVAAPARDGLIQGRMDRQRPILYVNGVSFLGLRRAADLAVGQGRPDLATHWRQLAADIQRAYRRRLADPLAACNERTLASALWPTGIASASETRDLLDRCPTAWTKAGRPLNWPLWTYFDLAQAHQRLAVGQPEQAAAMLHWFQDHDPMPGAYLYWEGRLDPDYFGRRASLHIPGGPVTPHAWSAAEDLLLRLEMLARIDPSDDALVIGPGLTRRDLSHPLQVTDLGTGRGPTTWSWDGSTTVAVRRMPPGVRSARLGAAFPPGARIVINDRS